MKNAFYYQNVLRLGGTTTYVYELLKKYHNTKDITLYYKTGDDEQLERLRKLCRVVKWNGEDEIKCDVFLTNYDFDKNVLNKFKAKRYYQVIHAMYKTNKIAPRLNKRFDAYVCVSDIVKQEFQELTNIPDSKLMVSHNPLTMTKEEAKPKLLIGFFTRITWEKGLNQMKELIRRLDQEDVNYLCLIYTNEACGIKSDNVLVHRALVNNVRQVMATMDVVGQLSKCEGDNYTTKEAKMCGCKLLLSDIETFKENNLVDEDAIVMNYDLSNINEVVKKIKALADAKASGLSKWKPIEDIYDEILVDGISDYNYEEEKAMKVKFMIDIERGCTFKELDNTMFRKGEVAVIDEETANKGVKLGYGHIIGTFEETIKPIEEPKVEEPKKVKEAPKKKPTTKKTKK